MIAVSTGCDATRTVPAAISPGAVDSRGVVAGCVFGGDPHR